jgi:hypothetical protein
MGQHRYGEALLWGSPAIKNLSFFCFVFGFFKAPL